MWQAPDSPRRPNPSIVSLRAVQRSADEGGISGREMRELFREFDRRGTGSVTASDFLSVLRRHLGVGNLLGAGAGRDEAEAVVRLFDRNGDGMCDYNDLIDMALPGVGLSRREVEKRDLDSKRKRERGRDRDRVDDRPLSTKSKRRDRRSDGTSAVEERIREMIVRAVSRPARPPLSNSWLVPCRSRWSRPAFAHSPLTALPPTNARPPPNESSETSLIASTPTARARSARMPSAVRWTAWLCA